MRHLEAVGKVLIGWPTPNTCERGPEQKEAKDLRGSGGIDLQSAVQLAGLPTTTVSDHRRGTGTYRPHDTGIPLPQVAAMMGYPTPRAEERSQQNSQDAGVSLSKLVSGWATPTTQDSANNAGPSQWNRNSLPLNCEAETALTHGPIHTGTPAETPGEGLSTVAFRLNPSFSLWLMGFPIEWARCAARVTQSSRKSRRSSSAP
ncbi:MAG: hypothetical protein NT069_29290 [Planctomycetota bacterium]|nr:hypothetical protein [Planctomycetota bacterium]